VSATLAKVCGLTRPEDAAFCAAAGADWLGFIFHRPSPRYIDPAAAAKMATGAAARVGVFGPGCSAAEAAGIMKAARLDLAQLHGDQSPGFCRELGAERVVKVMWPRRFESLEDLAGEAERFAAVAAYFLLDAGLGGGGHGLNLETDFLRGLRLPRPWLLAGGLTAQSVAGLAPGALAGLAGFDFNSRVEKAPGVKDAPAVRAALAAARKFDQDRRAAPGRRAE
jgi:phosphoribosylanthranilate isomerase